MGDCVANGSLLWARRCIVTLCGDRMSVCPRNEAGGQLEGEPCVGHAGDKGEMARRERRHFLPGSDESTRMKECATRPLRLSPVAMLRVHDEGAW